jgi:hypothetical protein
MDSTELPKGMYKLPEEFAEETVNPLTHEDVNYSRYIRKALESLIDDGIEVSIQHLELKESLGEVTTVGLVIGVRKIK